MLDIDFKTLDEGLAKLKKLAEVRDSMGEKICYNICNEECFKFAGRLAAKGADRQELAKTGGWNTWP